MYVYMHMLYIIICNTMYMYMYMHVDSAKHSLSHCGRIVWHGMWETPPLCGPLLPTDVPPGAVYGGSWGMSPALYHQTELL